ncbi:peptidylprolyl isomerase [Oscillatoria sp. FACHB-1407]|uniref:peptidylprolyl isomerase n=1 Tax=Oscillatoria sp. FACHB-1407 TaxID=2692847 RepID=UPI0016880C13|nr:peptidylprolyl isomerase [Oscillatoria sp. FACHB-1407]MBD2460704.1 peptidylprolyl isomerase [Oscillatoria sp. FACHB-1407]
MIDSLKRWLRAGMVSAVLLLLALTLNIALENSPAAAAPVTADVLISRLPAGNPISDGKALLRYALPIDNQAVRKLQVALEDISTTLRVSRKRLSGINGNLTQAERILSRKAELLASVPSDRQPQAEVLITEIGEGIAAIRADVEAQDREAIWTKRSELLDKIGELEELMVTGFPYEVPAEYSNLPQLKGRATIAFKTSKGDMKAVVDGYSAPVTAGNFVDLVKRGFYDNLPFTRAEESYVLQVGDPPGPEVGFVDPDTGKYRAIPLEVLVKGDKEPTYGITLEDAGRFLEQPVLPFSAYGALALARPSSDPNGGSSQFFFFLFEPELTPAGANLLDGRYSIFGFVTEGKEVLEKLKAGDLIESAKVVDGLENLVEPKA